jgi:hypothetical protein
MNSDNGDKLISITIDGIMLVKQILSTVSDKINDKKAFEEDINNVQRDKRN